MKTLFSFLAILLFFSCKHEELSTNNNKVDLEVKNITNSQLISQAPKKDYQLLSPSVKFFIEANSTVPDVESQKQFISKSGLPLDKDFYEWGQSHDINQSLDIFKDYISKNQENKYINTFRQYEGWLLLTHFDLLSNTDKQEQVKTILTELINSKYRGYGLLYYSMNYLYLNKNINLKSVNELYNQIISYTDIKSQTFTPITQAEIKGNNKPLPPGVLDMVNKHLMEKSESFLFLEKMKMIGK